MNHKDNRAPDRFVEVDGYQVAAYLDGSGKEVLLALNGGPGLPSVAMRASLGPAVAAGYRVVTFDQLGTGRSDHPNDPALWTIERYCKEVETVRRALDLGPVHLLGHSWGGWLAIEYAATHGGNLASLILEGTCADMDQFAVEARRLCAALGPETVTMMERHEAAGDFGHPEYRAAITLLDYRHVLRMQTIPEIETYQAANHNRAIYEAMQGPNEFYFTGNLLDWNRLGALRALACPALVMVGEHDHITPACSLAMHAVIPDSTLHVFTGLGHGIRRECPERFFEALLPFLDRVSGQRRTAAASQSVNA